MTSPQVRPAYRKVVTVVCPRRCGTDIHVGLPRLRGTPRGGLVGRWWRRLTLRGYSALREYRLGRDVEEALLFHWLSDCPIGLGGDDCPIGFDGEEMP